MATIWNMFSEEVALTREAVRAWGLKESCNRMHCTSYKQQAKLELARRLEAEDKIRELESRMAKLVDENDALRS